MSQLFQLSSESIVELPYTYCSERNISMIGYTYAMHDEIYMDDQGQDPEAFPRFYEAITQGIVPTTSQITEYRFYEYFSELLKKGDILHISTSSTITPSVYNAQRAAKQLMEENPGRSIRVIDSLCVASGLGLLVDMAADLRDEGQDLDTVFDWVRNNRTRIHHHFYVSDIHYLHRSGRLNGPAAMIATVLNILPLIWVDRSGKLIAHDKVRGKKAAWKQMAEIPQKHAVGGTQYDQKFFFTQSNCREEAEKLADYVTSFFPNTKAVRIHDISPIIAIHTGPGAVGFAFFGDERAE